MDRLASRALIVAAAALIAFASAASGAEPKTKTQQDAGRTESGVKKGKYSLGEVQILGSAEHPQVLFFLPRAKFRLLPLPENEEGKKIILLDDKIKGEKPE